MFFIHTFFTQLGNIVCFIDNHTAINDVLSENFASSVFDDYCSWASILPFAPTTIPNGLFTDMCWFLCIIRYENVCGTIEPTK